MLLCAVTHTCALQELAATAGVNPQAEAYEVHVTVNPPTADSPALFLARFRQVCRDLRVKALVIDLGPQILAQPMTCSRLFGSQKDAHAEGQRLKNALQEAGFTVTRLKIEAAPWNPDLPAGGYYEHHVRLYLENPNQQEPILRQLCTQLGVYLSRNPYKVSKDGCQQRFVTLRHPQVTPAQATAQAEQLHKSLQGAGFTLEKMVTEYCVYDDYRELDADWEGHATK